ncbi:MAG: sulfite exporter TauE/SafE family protein [Kofleriaceae bacterium]
MVVAAFALSLLIGITLGLLGGGGSILTLPILTYVAGLETKAAIAASLFVVAVTSAVSTVSHARAGRVQWRIGLVFGVAGMIGAQVGGALGRYLSGRTLMVLFAAVMVAAAIAMLRGRRGPGDRAAPTALPILQILLLGIGVGVVAGLVGAGGGFLIVPALVLLGGLPMDRAVGTSLLVISMQSFSGFFKHLGHVQVDWPITLGVTAAAIAGSFVGVAMARRVQPATLRRAFGVFVLLMAALVLSKELL